MASFIKPPELKGISRSSRIPAPGRGREKAGDSRMLDTEAFFVLSCE